MKTIQEYEPEREARNGRSSILVAALACLRQASSRIVAAILDF